MSNYRSNVPAHIVIEGLPPKRSPNYASSSSSSAAAAAASSSRMNYKNSNSNNKINDIPSDGKSCPDHEGQNAYNSIMADTIDPDRLVQFRVLPADIVRCSDIKTLVQDYQSTGKMRDYFGTQVEFSPEQVKLILSRAPPMDDEWIQAKKEADATRKVEKEDEEAKTLRHIQEQANHQAALNLQRQYGGGHNNYYNGADMAAAAAAAGGGGGGGGYEQNYYPPAQRQRRATNPDNDAYWNEVAAAIAGDNNVQPDANDNYMQQQREMEIEIQHRVEAQIRQQILERQRQQQQQQQVPPRQQVPRQQPQMQPQSQQPQPPRQQPQMQPPSQWQQQWQQQQHQQQQAERELEEKEPEQHVFYDGSDSFESSSRKRGRD